ncbi:MAG TPA: hypothetical protein V6C58_24335, partial [Allocoleopsis sp.]
MSNYYDNTPKRKVICEDLTTFTIKGKGNKIKIKSGNGYTELNKLLAVVNDTGNDLHFSFPSWNQNSYNELELTLDYSQAHYMYHLLKFI